MGVSGVYIYIQNHNYDNPAPTTYGLVVTQNNRAKVENQEMVHE